MVKNYVLDTNLLMDDPNIIFNFEDNNVYITGTTLQELDAHKNDEGERGYNVRETGRILDKLREDYGDMTKGVPLPNGGNLYVMTGGVTKDNLPEGYSLRVPDNRIISSSIELVKNNQNTILVANDTFMRINASACGLAVQSLKKNRVENTSYTGHRIIDITDPDILTDIYTNKKIGRDVIIGQMREDEPELLENEFLTLRCGEGTALTVHRNKRIELISDNNVNNSMHLYGHIKPINFMQYYALWALMHPFIELVVLKGPAGTAKTFLSLAAGLTQLNAGKYDQIFISRPNVEGSDQGFGTLPGTLSDKMAPLLASYNDNLNNLNRMQYKKYKDVDITAKTSELFASGKVDICPLNYIRGRSLDNKYLICDEAQNANAKLMKAVVTRAGNNTKIVVAGDAEQCDALNIDEHNNGLVYVAEMMKGSPRTAVIQFGNMQCARSGLAKDAIDRMR